MRVAGAALLALAAVLAASCAATAADATKAAASVPAGGLVLRNPGFEAPYPAGGRCPPGWDCSAHSGALSFRFFSDEAHPASGRASGCIEPVTHEPWGKIVQGHAHVDALRGKRVRLSALVRLENVAGKGAGLMALAQGGSGNVLASRRELQAGTSDWHPVQVEMEVPRLASVLELGLVMEGTGRACMDEVRFEVL